MAKRPVNPDKLQAPSDATRYVFENYDRARKIVEARQPQWLEGMRAYRSVIDLPKEDPDNSVSRLIIPLIFSDIEAIGPRIIQNNPRIEVWGREEADERRAFRMKSLLFYFWDFMGMAFKLVNFIKSAEIYGTAIFKVVYKNEKQFRLVRSPVQKIKTVLGFVPIGTESVLEYGAKKITTWDDPHVSLRPLDQIFPDPDGEDIESCQYVIDRVPISLFELENAEKDDEPLYDQGVVRELKKRLTGKGNPRQTGASGPTTLSQLREEFGNEPELPPDPNKVELHLLECWEDARVIAVIEEYEDLDPVRNEYNESGEKPFVKFTPIPIPNEFYGMSIPEVLLSMQVELSSIHSLHLDNLSYSVHQMWKILRTSGINPRNLKFRPGGHVWVKDMQDIQPMQSSFTDFSLHRVTDEIGKWAQKSGMTDTAKGVKSDLSGRTATEASLLAEASGSRISLMLHILSNQALKPLGKKLVRLYELFMEEQKQVRILGDGFASKGEFVRVSPEDLVGGSGLDLDVIIDIAQTDPVNRQFKLARAKDMLQSLAQFGLSPNHPVVKLMMIEILRGYDIPNPETIVNSPEAQAAGEEGETGEGEGGGDVAGLLASLGGGQ